MGQSLELTGVSCPTEHFCVAVGGPDVSIYQSGSWGSLDAIDSGGSLTGVSCASVDDCVAVDSSGNAISFNGSEWSANEVSGGSPLEGISCPTTSFCATFDEKGSLDLLQDGRLSDSTHVTGIDHVTSLSCVGPGFCVAVTVGGHSTTFDGVTWSHSQSINPRISPNGDFWTTVECTSTVNCTSLTSLGWIYAFNGSTWDSSPMMLPGITKSYEDVPIGASCPTPRRCFFAQNQFDFQPSD
jgi:hypothetical protein